MGALESLLSALGIKKAVAFAGLVGGLISGALLPGPLAAIKWVSLRSLSGGLIGLGIAGYGAPPLSAALNGSDYVVGVALVLGLIALSFVAKVTQAWNDFDLGDLLKRGVDKLMGGQGK